MCWYGFIYSRICYRSRFFWAKKTVLMQKGEPQHLNCTKYLQSNRGWGARRLPIHFHFNKRLKTGSCVWAKSANICTSPVLFRLSESMYPITIQKSNALLPCHKLAPNSCHYSSEKLLEEVMSMFWCLIIIYLMMVLCHLCKGHSTELHISDITL